eukprot:CAMPEP_0194098824 /NCGR_PEP_ID=MMETSP0150-20130528/141_1 /TAXON_ID=122233 /ORGANISM="Chaetoceros debilis, Strain MM31A-1" /LENGTH=75 /DNA_ID=CAMNT_0038784927 /DNA_START=356 /DNA_END=583 /DNA_ORIENTATION=+
MLAFVPSQRHFLVNSLPFHSKKKEVLGCSEQASTGDDDGNTVGDDVGGDDGDTVGDDVDGDSVGDDAGDSLPGAI